MTEYLSKEEIKKWRSSLEKITLEEYAARLGKVIEEEKQTNDLVDIVLHGQPVMSSDDKISKGEKISSIAQRAFEREKEIGHTPFAIHKDAKKEEIRTPKKEIKEQIKSSSIVAKVEAKVEAEDTNYVFRKALTDREQLVFEYFLKNKDKIVYAKDLAKLLDLPRDYVYKYIKNLRAKIEGDKLKNADKGGYVLTV
jgi:biotin operon repressor